MMGENRGEGMTARPFPLEDLLALPLAIAEQRLLLAGLPYEKRETRPPGPKIAVGLPRVVQVRGWGERILLFYSYEDYRSE